MIVEQHFKNKRPIRHCEHSEAIQTWAAHLRLSLNAVQLSVLAITGDSLWGQKTMTVQRDRFDK